MHVLNKAYKLMHEYCTTVCFKFEAMACNFSIPFSGSAQDVLGKAQSAVQKQGGVFEGDTSVGSFNLTVFGNTIAGSYAVVEQQLNIVIDNKPFLLPCSTIESFLKAQIGV
jgi:hypothetical protein